MQNAKLKEKDSKMATHKSVGAHFVSPHLHVGYISGRGNPSPTDTNCFDSKMAMHNLRRGLALRVRVYHKDTFILSGRPKVAPTSKYVVVLIAKWLRTIFVGDGAHDVPRRYI